MKCDDIISMEESFLLSNGRTVRVKVDSFACGQYASIHDAVLTRSDGTSQEVVVKVMGNEYSQAHARMETAIHFMACRCALPTSPSGTATGAPVLHGTFLWKNYFAMVMEKMHGSLYQLLKGTPDACRRAKLTKRAIEHVSRFLKAMQKKHQFMHRDLHGSNVLYTLKEGYDCAHSTPVSKFTFYVCDFGNASTKRLHCPELSGHFISHIQRHVYFIQFNRGLDLNTLILSIRCFLSYQLSEVPHIRRVVRHFFKAALQHSGYTNDAKLTLQNSADELGMNISKHPFLGDVPLFWFSYAAACQLSLPYTQP